MQSLAESYIPRQFVYGVLKVYNKSEEKRATAVHSLLDLSAAAQSER